MYKELLCTRILLKENDGYQFKQAFQFEEISMYKEFLCTRQKHWNQINYKTCISNIRRPNFEK